MAYIVEMHAVCLSSLGLRMILFFYKDEREVTEAVTVT